MGKNYFSLKTGHVASDEYFKRAPIYCDSDMLRTCLHGWFFRLCIYLHFICRILFRHNRYTLIAYLPEYK